MNVHDVNKILRLFLFIFVEWEMIESQVEKLNVLNLESTWKIS